MANWAYTNYVIEGTKETLNKIYDAIQHPDTSEGDEGWEGGILKALGITWKESQPDGSGYYMRGFIQEDTISFNEAENSLSFSAEEAWGATDFHKVLEENFPDIKVFYVVEEENEDIYATNDKEGKYFPDRFYVDTCIEGDYQSDYFTDKKDVFKWLKELSLGNIRNEKDVEDFNDKAAEDISDDFISIHEFKIVN